MSSRILIAGCGYVGRALAERLAAKGDKVWGLRRNPESIPGVIALIGDLSDPKSLDLPPDLDAVIYAAAPGRRDEQAYAEIYVRGVTHLLSALEAKKSSPRRLILTSSTGVYGQDDGSWVDEGSSLSTPGARARLLFEGERLWREAPWPSVVVRLSGLYGPTRTRLIRAVREAKVAASTAVRWTNRIHRDDAAGLIAHLLTLPRCEPLYLGTDSCPAPLHEVQAFIAARLGLPAPAPPPGGAPARNKRCSNARLLRSGYRLRYPSYEEGYAALLAADEAI